MRVLIAATLMLLTSCATSEEIILRQQVRDLQDAIAGKDDDLGYLMRENMELEIRIMQLENGAIWQARQMAKLRSRCEM